jgi:undecaprenyl-diphosphatase
MELIQGIILGLIQGLTEFFPVSSSGHLILVPRLFGWPDQGLAFDTVLHLGTLCAVIWAYRADLADLIRRIVLRREADAIQFGLKVVLAAIPGLAVGAIFGSAIESTLRGPMIVAIDLAFWGIVLLVVDRWTAKRRGLVTDAKRASWVQAIVVGLAQVIALMPGSSRSGTTMTGGMLSGLDRSAAVNFSFFVSIPTIAAAGGYGMLKIVRDPSVLGTGGVAPLIAGFLAAAIAGAWAIQFLRSYVAKHPLDIFAWYRIALAALVLLVVR